MGALARMGMMLLALIVAYLAATLAALFVAAWLSFLLPNTGPVPLLVAPAVGLYALLPALIVITIAELASLRSPVFYAATGVAIAVGAFVFLALQQHNAVEFMSGTIGWSAIALFAFCGPVAGLTYWWIAGRKAGHALNQFSAA